MRLNSTQMELMLPVFSYMHKIFTSSEPEDRTMNTADPFVDG